MLDAVWAQHIHFYLILAWHDAALLGIGLGVMLILLLFDRGRYWRQGALMAEYFSLTLVATCVFGVLSYLALASSGPLVDSTLLAADRALGFDWLTNYRFLLEHPVRAKILQLAYGSLFYQSLYFCLLMGLMDRKRDLRKMFWLVSVAGLFTSMGAFLFPALGPFHVFSAGPPGNFVAAMVHVKSGQNLTFALARMTGVVSFPSLHTTMALAFARGFRRCGVIGLVMGAFNLVMLCAVPYFGGHYLVDMIAGAGVFALSLGLVTFFGQLGSSAEHDSSGHAAESART